MFTKLHVSVHEYGGKTKLNAKNEGQTEAVNGILWYFWQITSKLSNNLTSKLY